MIQTSLIDGAGTVWRGITVEEANACLVAWGHRMGPCRRPCFEDVAAHALVHEGQPVALTITAGLIREQAAGCPWLRRDTCVELARLCAVRSGLCRVALRLWREFTWPTFGRQWALSYQDADLHTGATYRFDGWQRVAYSRAGGQDQRSGRRGRNKWLWQWPPDPPTSHK